MRTIAHLLLLILLAVLTACGATSPTPDPTATAAFGGDTASPGAESPSTDIGVYASGASDPATGLWLPIIPASSRPASGTAVPTSAPVELPGPGGAVLAIAG